MKFIFSHLIYISRPELKNIGYISNLGFTPVRIASMDINFRDHLIFFSLWT